MSVGYGGIVFKVDFEKSLSFSEAGSGLFEPSDIALYIIRIKHKVGEGVLRKCTNTYRILQANSKHPFAAKVASIKPLFDRVNNHCSTEEAKRVELKTLFRICRINRYSSNHIKAARRKPRVKNQNDNPTKRKALPCIAKVSEAAVWIPASFGIKVAHRPSQTIGDKPNRSALQETEKSSDIYGTNCDECDCYFVGETKKR